MARRPTRTLLAACAAALACALAAPPAQAADDVPAPLPAGLITAEGAPALPGGVAARAWLVADLDTGAVLGAQDAHARLAPASTLKVLTALALLPVVPAGTQVVPTQEQVDVEGSKVGLLARTGYPAEELYQALLMVSGNDAANALAGAAGGQEAAAALMNATAQRLGALDTRAVNPHGLDAEGQTSSPHDLAVLLRGLLEDRQLSTWAALPRTTVSAGPDRPRFEVVNKNKLLSAYQGALAGKNGYTSAAQASFVGAAERVVDGRPRRVAVALMRTQPRFWEEAAGLLDWGFAAIDAEAEPVGALPAPAQEQPRANVAEDRGGAGAVVRTIDVEVGGGRSLTVPARPVAGALLVVAALLVVRPRRALAPV
jgi:serine-type D-Ala-D-Ala carboxypeptidase (penicillin-binding protein 5/6)